MELIDPIRHPSHSLSAEDLTPEVLARGNPNSLDMMIAVFSGVIAAYALARPNLAGSLAGVAIAVALVPPLCSLGICLADRRLDHAAGAGTLFVTNLVAIVLAAALTFRLMGVTASRAATRQRRWVYQCMALLSVVAVVLAIPLEAALHRQVELGKPPPLGYPLPRSVAEAVSSHVDQDPGVEVMLMARPSQIQPDFDSVIYLCSEDPLPRSYADELEAIIRRETADPDARVLVISVQQAWRNENPNAAPDE